MRKSKAKANFTSDAEPPAGVLVSEDLAASKTRGATTRKRQARKKPSEAETAGATRPQIAGLFGCDKPAPFKPTKAGQVLNKLRSAKGVTIEMLREATGWQAHSVRGFLSGTVRKKLGLTLMSEAGKDGVRRYRISDNPKDN